MAAIQALFLATALLSAFGFIGSLLVLPRQRRYPGAGFWFAGVGCTACGAFLIGMRGIVPDFVSIFVANSLLFFTPTCIAESLRRFTQRPPGPRLDWALSIAATATFLYAFLEGFDARDRILLASLPQAALMLFPAWLALDLDGRNPEGRNWFLGLGFLLFALWTFLRFVFSWDAPADTPFAEMGGFQELYLILIPALWFLTMVGFGVLINQRLRRELEEESALLSRANQTKSRFFRLIAHDLRGPVGGVSSALDALLEDAEDTRLTEPDRPPDSDEALVDLELLRASARQARNAFLLLENLLDWARLQENLQVYNPEPVRLHELLQPQLEVLEAAAERKEVRLHTDPRLEDALLLCDPPSAGAILRNILSNAIKFSYRGGTVEIRTERVPEADGLLAVTVCDAGPGFDPLSLADLSESKGAAAASSRGTEGESGTGLGLALCREYAKGNGGRLEIASEPGHGAKIRVFLPLA